MKLDYENHIWNSGTLTKEASNTERGEKVYNCEICEATKTEVLYIGTKSPDQQKVIGDIVFVDGSAIPYSEDINLSDLQKSWAEAVIYYTDGSLGERTLGVNIHNSNGTKYPWSSKEALCYTKGTGYTTTNGKVSYNNTCKADPEGTSPENIAEKYPAFNYVYSNFPNYYMPAFDELYNIYEQIEIINSIIEYLNGTKLEGIYIASSYAGSNHQSVHYANLSTGHSGGIDKNSPQFVCAIREF